MVIIRKREYNEIVSVCQGCKANVLGGKVWTEGTETLMKCPISGTV